MDHPRVENLAGLVDDFYCYKILLLHLMGLKLISKFFFSGEAGFSCLACWGFGVCQTLELQQEAANQKSGPERGVSETGTESSWKPELL